MASSSDRREALLQYVPNVYALAQSVASDADTAAHLVEATYVHAFARLSGADDAPPAGLAFTTFELRMPGEDKIFGNEDDWIARNGVIMKIADVAKGGVGRSVSAGLLNP